MVLVIYYIIIILNIQIFFKNSEIYTIDIEIRDDNRNFIDFNNLDWTCTLQIDILSETIENIDNLADVYNNQAQELF